MPKLISYLKKISIIFTVLILFYFFLDILGFLDIVRPLYQASKLRKSQNIFGIEEICSNLLKGDYAAASIPIARKTTKRKLNIAKTILWLAKRENSPFIEIQKSQFFTELPSDQGPLQSCNKPRGVSMVRDKFFADIFLGYPQSRLTVSLQYSTSWLSPTLELIKIGKIEPLTPGIAPVDETTRTMEEFIGKLDQLEGNAGTLSKAQAKAATDRLVKEIESLPKGPFASKREDDLFYDREEDNFRLPSNYLAKAGPSKYDPNAQKILIYPAPMHKELITMSRPEVELMDKGLILLEVFPIPTGMYLKGDVVGDYEKMLKESAQEHPSWGAKVEYIQGLSLPTLLLTTKNPKESRLHMFGKNRLFIFTTYEWTPVFDGIVRTLKEAPQAKK
jgi:hypothetical protein